MVILAASVSAEAGVVVKQNASAELAAAVVLAEYLQDSHLVLLFVIFLLGAMSRISFLSL